MLTRKELKDKIRNLDEKNFRQVLSQLYEKMEYIDVRITHGTQEFGKDLVFYEEDKFGEKIWFACVVKKGDANQSLYGDISRQVAECLVKPFDHHIYGKVKITRVFVVVSGSYKDNTKALITESIKNGENPIKYFEGSNIAELIEWKDLGYLFDEQENLSVANALHKEFVINNLINNTTLKFLEADFGILLDEMDDFSINVRAKSNLLFEERKNYVEEKEHKISFKILPEIAEIIISKKPYLLNGIATSGKTTILKKLGKDFLKLNPSGRLFFFELNKIAKDTSFDLQKTAEGFFLNLTGVDFDWLDNSKVLILLDGLDETSDDEIRSCIIVEILKLIKNPNCQIIITSRSIDFLTANNQIESNFERFELLPLNYNEMVQIGNKILSDPSQAKNFVHLVKNSELLNSFPKTPLTTILLAILLKEEKIDVKELPKNISELYSKFIDLFLNKWDKGKGISEQYKYAEKEYVIKSLAQELHKNNKISFSEEDILKFLNSLKKERPIDILSNPSEFLNNLCDRSSLLIRDSSDGTYKFFHLTLQEYLTAATLTNNDERLLTDNFLNDWWLNPNIFYAGKHPSDSNVLREISSLKTFPYEFDEKMKFIINTSKVLKAVHLWDHENRKRTLISMLKVFEGMISDVISAYIDSEILTLRNKSLLDVVLWSRSFFLEFLDSEQFTDTLKSIFEDMKVSPSSYNDIIRYCLSYSLSLKEGNSIYLEEFIESDELMNPRWFKIVFVDINVKKLNRSNNKLILKFKQKAFENKKYIQKQFQDRVKVHYTSITGLPPLRNNEIETPDASL